jgi:hypothetical protein
VQGGLQGEDGVSDLFRLYGGINGDGAINGTDLAQFRRRCGVTLV